MWHVLHLIAAPIEFLLGAFCIVTAIILYPNEEGNIQSRFEDFWIQVDDYQQLALSKHTAFMTQVARLETAFLDLVFGEKLASVQAMAVSLSISLLSVVLVCYAISEIVAAVVISRGPRQPTDYSDLVLLALVAAGLGISSIVLRKAKGLTKNLVICGFVLVLALMLAFKHSHTSEPIFAAVSVTALSGFVCDVLFIAFTRALLRWAGQMKSFIRILTVLLLNLLLAVLLLVPAALPKLIKMVDHNEVLFLSSISTGLSNIFDALLAVLFFLLAVILLIHRALWPLLTRTLFRMQDIGTKGRRAILVTIGLALLGAAGFHITGVWEKLIDSLGKG